MYALQYQAEPPHRRMASARFPGDSKRATMKMTNRPIAPLMSQDFVQCKNVQINRFQRPPPPISGFCTFRSIKPLDDGESIAEFYPTPSRISSKDKDLAAKSLFGTITGLNIEKSFGFITTKQSLPQEYKGKSLFFHFDIVKNVSEAMVVLRRGMTVKFIPYKGSFDKPKAFAVFLHNEYEEDNKKAKKKGRVKEAIGGKKSSVKQKNNSLIKQIQNELKSKGPPKKVSIFWDIENCRPKKNSILQIVGKIRELVLQGQQVSSSSSSSSLSLSSSSSSSL